jgi:hypothetical protein
MRRFEFLITEARTATPGTWEDGSRHPVSFTIIFADDDFLASGFDPSAGFYCEVEFVSTEPAWPVVGAWVSDGGAVVGYELPATAVVQADYCDGRIHTAYANYLDVLTDSTIGVGLHALTPKDQKELAAAIPSWTLIRDWALGSGWHIEGVAATGAAAAYSGSGYAIGHEIDAYETVLLDGADQPMPRARSLSLPFGELPTAGWYEGEVFAFWPVDAVF